MVYTSLIKLSTSSFPLGYNQILRFIGKDGKVSYVFFFFFFFSRYELDFSKDFINDLLIFYFFFWKKK